MPSWWRVTKAMKEAGAHVAIRELGAQFIPDWLDEEEFAERVFLAMHAAMELDRLDTTRRNATEVRRGVEGMRSITRYPEDGKTPCQWGNFCPAEALYKVDDNGKLAWVCLAHAEKLAKEWDVEIDEKC